MSRSISPPRSRGRSARALTVTYRAVASLILDSKNPRRHDDRQIEQLARSIETFGFNVPVLISADSQVLAGHGRLAAATGLGLRDVPTITIDHLNEAQRRAFAIADNALATKAEWDPILLGEQFALLSAADLDFDLTVTGFDVAEIDLAIQGLTPATPDADPDDASIQLRPRQARSCTNFCAAKAYRSPGQAPTDCTPRSPRIRAHSATPTLRLARSKSLRN